MVNQKDFMPGNPCKPLEHTIEFLDGKTWEGGVRRGIVQTMVVTINLGLNKSAGHERTTEVFPPSCGLVSGDGPAETLMEAK